MNPTFIFMEVEKLEYEVALGDRVYTKKTGILAPATIIAITHSERYNRMIISRELSTKLWSDLYPDWQSKPIVLLEFDKPQRSCTYEEYCQQNEKYPDWQSLHEDEKQFYYERSPVVYFVIAPIEDIEVIS